MTVLGAALLYGSIPQEGIDPFSVNRKRCSRSACSDLPDEHSASRLVSRLTQSRPSESSLRSDVLFSSALFLCDSSFCRFYLSTLLVASYTSRIPPFASATL